jgi:hypothetical protein
MSLQAFLNDHRKTVVDLILTFMSLQSLLNESQQSGSGPLPNVNEFASLVE